MYLSLIIGTNAVISRLRYRETLKVTVSLGNIAAVTVIWASPSLIILAICLRVWVTGDTHITRVLGMGMPKTRGCPTVSVTLLSPSCIPRLFALLHAQGLHSSPTTCPIPRTSFFPLPLLPPCLFTLLFYRPGS